MPDGMAHRSFGGGGSMWLKIANKPEVVRKIDRISSDGARKAVRYLFSDIKRRVPTAVARIAAQRYNIAATKLNPNTKAGSSRATAFVHGGGSLGSLSWEYIGPKLKIGGGASNTQGSFPLSPQVHNTSGYTATTSVLRGHRATVGHWNVPKGPRFRPAVSGSSPNFIHPSIRLIMKRTTPGHTALDKGPMVGLSVAEMVNSKKTESQRDEAILKLVEERMGHCLDRALHA